MLQNCVNLRAVPNEDGFHSNKYMPCIQIGDVADDLMKREKETVSCMRNDFYARNEAQRNHRFRVGRKRAVSTSVGAVCARRPPCIGYGSSSCSLVARPRSSPVKLLALVSSPCWPRAQLISLLPPPAGAGVYLPRRERAPHHSLSPGPRDDGSAAAQEGRKRRVAGHQRRQTHGGLHAKSMSRRLATAWSPHVLQQTAWDWERTSSTPQPVRVLAGKHTCSLGEDAKQIRRT
jgi:hypothetical protein